MIRMKNKIFDEDELNVNFIRRQYYKMWKWKL